MYKDNAKLLKITSMDLLMVTDLESGSTLLLEAPALLALVEVLPPPTRLLLRHPFFNFLSVEAA